MRALVSGFRDLGGLGLVGFRAQGFGLGLGFSTRALGLSVFIILALYCFMIRVCIRFVLAGVSCFAGLMAFVQSGRPEKRNFVFRDPYMKDPTVSRV